MKEQDRRARPCLTRTSETISERRGPPVPNGPWPSLGPVPHPACGPNVDGSSPSRPCRQQPGASRRRNRKGHWNRRTVAQMRARPCPLCACASRRRSAKETLPLRVHPRGPHRATARHEMSPRQNALHFAQKASLLPSGSRMASPRQTTRCAAFGKCAFRWPQTKRWPQTAGFAPPSPMRKQTAASRPPFVSSLRTKEYSLDQPMERPFEHRGAVLFRLRKCRSR